MDALRVGVEVMVGLRALNIEMGTGWGCRGPWIDTDPGGTLWVTV